MSYLHRVRLAFAGTFQADVSTVNNDVRNYRRPHPASPPHGLQNPTGSGAFRLIDCKVTGVGYEDGSWTDKDPVVGMRIAGAAGRTSAKLVDLDPQWQMASTPWGLEVRLTDGEEPAFFAGRYQPHAFRDLWLTRTVGQRNDRAGSATFQSVLDEVTWAAGASDRSRFLRELRTRTEENRLSVRLTTFGYERDVRSPSFTLGTVIGAIGPYFAGEPASFVAGRRFVPAGQFASWNGITYCTGLLDDDPPSTLFLDLSNALPFEAIEGRLHDIGRLAVGVLRHPAAAENTLVTRKTFQKIAEIPYLSPGWLVATGGVFAVAAKAGDPLELARDHPLALVTNGVVAIRESVEGLFVGAEPLVHRIDPGRSSRLTVHARRYGKPMPDATVRLQPRGPMTGVGVGPDAPREHPPRIGVPERALDCPASAKTGPDGSAEVTLAASDPGHPRRGIDGQVYLVDYRLGGRQENAVRHPFDCIAVHVRDHFDPPKNPSWEHVGPILTRYARLYPVMKTLVDLAHPGDIARHKQRLLLALELDLSDPNFMPVTRDLSDAKRKTIVRWLKQLRPTDPTPAPAGPAPAEAVVEPTASADPGSKTRFADTFLRRPPAP